MRNRIDLIGKTYGAFVVAAYLGERFYLLRCKICGHEIKRRSNQIRCNEVRKTCPACNGILTNMENQVAELTAQGLQNKEIAKRLVLSTRTVQSHLTNIYAKLGLDG